MKQLTSVLSAPLQAIGLIPKTPKMPAPLPQVDPDQARIAAEQNDELASRRGGAADILTGSMGAEPTAGQIGKATLGS
jgi:hypothetical protein